MWLHGAPKSLVCQAGAYVGASLCACPIQGLAALIVVPLRKWRHHGSLRVLAPLDS